MVVVAVNGCVCHGRASRLSVDRTPDSYRSARLPVVLVRGD
ncbi:hypothetical protein AIOL_002106 [Candidatus Rhodobacter oscarellae]|uniref:Uncharacterized protein n=1 Tax=Candidatus Rhodobacter oscarellae TaxID=1675527 RepID=A0A0J9E2S7_9RHOB|nr:hypothetical protein AIOL_002106 [Candidatus Rhodobacter lobularis]